MSLNVGRDVTVSADRTITASLGSSTRLLGSVVLVHEEWPSVAGSVGQILYVRSDGALDWKSEATAATSFTPVTVSEDYTVVPSVNVVLVAAAPVSITLLDIATAGNKFITIVDSGGNATISNPIVINAASGEFILGSDSYAITSAYNSVKLFNDGDTRWFLG